MSFPKAACTCKPKGLFGHSIAVALLLLAVACGGAATVSPAPTKAPQAAGGQPPAPAAATSRLTKNIPTPLYWPTFADYEVATSPLWSGERTNNLGHSLWQRRFLEYAIGYAATECVAGRELSFEGFRAFVTELSGEGGNAIRAKTNRVIGQMLALSASGARLDCLNPYLHPTTGTEVYLAADLVYVAGSGDLAWEARVYYRAALKERAFSWFGEGAQQGQTILQRFRDFGSLKYVEIPANVPVPNNTTGLYPTAWAVERELWELRQVPSR